MGEPELRYPASVNDARDVHLSLLPGAPPVSTPAGKLPIEVRSVGLHYSMDGRLWRVEVDGDPTDPKDRERRTEYSWRTGTREPSYVRSVKRRLDVDRLPPWLEELADRYRPRVRYLPGDRRAAPAAPPGDTDA